MTAKEARARTLALQALGRLPVYKRATHAGPDAPGAKKPGTYKPPDCTHRGKPTGVSRPCGGCGGKKTPVPLLACGVYGLCAAGAAVTLEDGTPVRPCNDLCPGYRAAPQLA